MVFNYWFCCFILLHNFYQALQIHIIFCGLIELRSKNLFSIQEYAPGVVLVPMGSRTGKPFRTTNLIVFAPKNVPNDSGKNGFIACGDALIVDPGCQSKFHEELRQIVAALPRKLIVFVTHHHRDHVDDDWSLGFTAISGTEEICIGEAHLCFSQGSAILDVTSGGNMTDYFQSTYKFMEISPHALIPMHGRVNLWPKHMLCGYLRKRRGRESSILKAIENGAETLFDIVANVYSEVDRSFWIPAASNVRLHVDHLSQQDKLPKVKVS
ncbi:putative metallo-beta-lactamase [Rosa chinensis]|uniref:Putative metallo-beta-lactamase n=1 Tax=Rosa chinensis TaxID=74649 RepID=A0A2P6PIR3_ROSCH|nr:putative metallo-beta-lactamase [Rosa chinensis]